MRALKDAPMLGSHFDLAKEVAAIAARRDPEKPLEKSPEQIAAYADFDKRIRDFVDALAPVDRASGSRQIIGNFLDED